MTSTPVDRSPVVRVIGAYRLGKAVLLVAAGFGVLELRDPGATKVLAHWLGGLRFASEFQFMHTVIDWIAGLTLSRVNQMAIAVFLIAALDCLEGIGMLLGQVWAEYLTIVATGSFIPLEIYEVIKKLTLPRSFALIANVLIVIYLAVHRLRAHRKATAAARA